MVINKNINYRKRANSKSLLVLLGFTFVTFLFLNNISAVDTCWIETNAATCTQNGGNSVMRVSAATNAHGELVNQGNYANVLCCNFGAGNIQCVGNNKIVGLSSSTNAHAESPSLINPNYGVDVCYDSLKNGRRVDAGVNCDTVNNEIPVIYISSLTNAHIEGSGLINQNYASKICARVELLGTECTLNSASWDITQTSEGQSVGLQLTTSNCAGQEISFNVLERDNLGGDDAVTTNPVNVVVGSGETAIGTWTAEWQAEGWPETNPPEYYFEATLVGTGTKIQSSNELQVYQGNLICTLNSASWSATEKVEGQSVFLNVAASNCVGQEISFNVLERDNLGGDDPVATNPGNVVVGSGETATGTWTAEWQAEGWPESDPPEYYFRATIVSNGAQVESSNELQVYQSTPPSCDNTPTCSGYLSQADCGNDLCGVAPNSVPSTIDCSAPGTTCFCAWDSATSQCNGAVNIIGGGQCGDGTTDAGELCDDGNTVSGDGCEYPSCVPTPPISCNNNNIAEPPEEFCDGTDLNGETCITQGFDGGQLLCNSCGFDTSPCTTVDGGQCGDGTTDAGELCDDGNTISGDGCEYPSCVPTPPISCNNNNIAEPPEEFCDGTDLNGETCQSLGFDSGTLACDSCGFDTSNCAATPAVCGDGIIQDGEQCDGSNWGPVTSCSNFGLTDGSLTCRAPGTANECLFDTSQCIGIPGVCDDGIINPGETCDSGIGVFACSDFDLFKGGVLACPPQGSPDECQLDTSQCTGGTAIADGTCYSDEEESTDTCEDGGYLTVNLIATWILRDGSVGSNPECQSTTETIQCPSQIPLPFFTVYNLLAALAVIALIYWVMHRKKAKRKK